MALLAFASRNSKEVLRDPLNIAFGLGFPLVVLFLLSAIQANVPVPMFQIELLTPGVAVFGLSFIALFSGMLVARDRGTSFLMRLFTSPLKAADYILGYALPFIPIALAQVLITFLAAALLGFELNLNSLMALLVMLPILLFFVGFGLLAGSLFTDKQVGGICGALLTNLSAWLSGIWFDVELVGGWFKALASGLPFLHAVDAAKLAVAGNYAELFPRLWWVIGYAAATFGLAIWAFRRQMRA